MTMAEFVLARIAEEKAAVQRLADRYNEDLDVMYWQAKSDDVEVHLSSGRALAECEAKQFVVDHYLAAKRARDGIGSSGTVEQARIYMAMQAIVMALQPLVAKIAALYASHPDYHEEWKLCSFT